MRSQNGAEERPKMCLFLRKSPLFAHPLWRQVDVLSWKMIARHHSKVHWTAGRPRVFRFFLSCERFPFLNFFLASRQ